MDAEPNRAQTKLNALVIYDPDLARASVLHCAKVNHGVRKDMAKALGVSISTLWRTITNLGIGDQVNAMRSRLVTCGVCDGSKTNEDGAACTGCMGSGYQRKGL